LFYFEGFPIERLARIYKKSPAAIKMVLARGRKQLRDIVLTSMKTNRGIRDIPQPPPPLLR